MAAAARGNRKDTVKTGHGCTTTTSTLGCSNDVLINDIGAVRFGDTCDSHTIPRGSVCVPHQPTLTTASSSVIINGKGAGRQGDGYSGEIIISGSPDVIFG